MKRYILPYLTCFIFIFAFSSCRQDGPAPIRNIKGGPKLLKAQAGAGCQTYTYTKDQKLKPLGNVFTREVLISFKDGLSHEQELEALKTYDFVKQLRNLEDPDAADIQRLELVEGLNCSQVEQALQLLESDVNIVSAAPMFIQGDKLLSVTGEVMVTREAGGEQ